MVGALLVLRYVYSTMGLGRENALGDDVTATSYMHYGNRLVIS